jgi:hypothetical protein
MIGRVFSTDDQRTGGAVDDRTMSSGSTSGSEA